MPAPINEIDLPAHFWARVDCSGECWLWRGSIKPNGYGQLPIHRRTVHAHRYAYELAYGAIPAGLFVLHRCDVPSCVRPEHLRLGTHEDNMADMTRKGRQRMGDRCAWAKLTAAQVLELREYFLHRLAPTQEDKQVWANRLGIPVLYVAWLTSLRSIRRVWASAEPEGWQAARDAANQQCGRGHVLAEVGQYVDPHGKHECRECRRIHTRMHKARIRARAESGGAA